MSVPPHVQTLRFDKVITCQHDVNTRWQSPSAERWFCDRILRHTHRNICDGDPLEIPSMVSTTLYTHTRQHIRVGGPFATHRQSAHYFCTFGDDDDSVVVVGRWCPSGSRVAQIHRVFGIHRRPSQMRHLSVAYGTLNRHERYICRTFYVAKCFVRLRHAGWVLRIADEVRVGWGD